MGKTVNHHNRIKKLEIETRELFERESLSTENIQTTLPIYIVNRLDNNQLTRSIDTSKHEETHKLNVNPEP